MLEIATCDKGLLAVMTALAGAHDLPGVIAPGVIVPGGATLPPVDGEDAGKVQTLGAGFAHELVTLEEAATLGCRACASPGGGCQFMGTAATAQEVVSTTFTKLRSFLPKCKNIPDDLPEKLATQLLLPG